MHHFIIVDANVDRSEGMCWVGLGWVGLIFLSSFDVTPIAMADKLLVHLVFPRCKVPSVEFPGRKSTSHLSVHWVDFFFVGEPVLLVAGV